MGIYQPLARAHEWCFRLARRITVRRQGAPDVMDLLRRQVGLLLGEQRLIAADVGGAVGLQPHWNKLKGNGEILVFEPHPGSFSDLQKKYAADPFSQSFTLLPFALSGQGGERTLCLTNSPTGSTIAEFNPDFPFFHQENSYFFPMKKQPIQTHTLAEVLRERKLPRLDLIKLDIQGAEQEVLEGLGAANLKHLLAFEMEVPLQPIYREGTTLAGMMKLTEALGFDLFDLRVARDYTQQDGRSHHHKKLFGVGEWHPSVAAKAWEAEMICFRRPGPLLQAGDGPGLQRLLACYCIYNFYTEALLLVQAAQEKKIFSPTEAAAMEAAVRAAQKWSALDLAHYATRTAAFRNSHWGQYMWLTLPTT